MALHEEDLKNMFRNHDIDDEARNKIDQFAKQYEDLAINILASIDQSPEITVAIRKLMESKRDVVYAIVKDYPVKD